MFIFSLIIFILLNFSLQAQNRIKDTCFYSLSIPPNLDLPNASHFDTTFSRDNNCKVQIIVCPLCGTEASYLLYKGSKEKPNQLPIRHCKAFHGKEGKIDITHLPQGTYTMNATEDCNWGKFTIHLK